ncbi:MAG: CopG family transcriptional regulator [Deltaproteobacteria bacterium]|nr:CopG family transcriptional regulator [Deltaproteobacteria bacterium]
MKNSKRTSNKNKSDDPLSGDLSNLFENKSWQRVRFELKPKNKTVTIRMSEDLLNAVKHEADEYGLEYQKFIRIALERIVGKS